MFLVFLVVFLHSFIIMGIVLWATSFNVYVVMAILILLSGVLAADISNGRLGIGEKQLMYNSVLVNVYVKICNFLVLAFAIYLLFMNWRLLLISFGAFLLFSNTVIRSISELLLIRPLAAALYKMGKSD